jgi:hypothetical protein
MPRLSGFLDHVMNPPARPSPPANPPNDEDSFEPEFHHTPDAVNDTSNSQEVRLALEFAEACMDHHSLEGAVRDDIRRFAKVSYAFILIICRLQ